MPYKIDKVIASSFEILNSPNPTTKIVSLIPQPDIDIGKITNKFVMQITEKMVANLFLFALKRLS